MSTNEKGVSTEVPVAVEIEPLPTIYTAEAQARLDELRQLRDRIPHFVIPAFAGETKSMNSVASVPPQFIELTAVALANREAFADLQVGTPAEMRDLLQYAEAFEPLADEFEAMAQFVRHSVKAARNKAGRQALTVYAFAKRLAKFPATAALAPHVADMRRALGRIPTPEVRARRAAKKALHAPKAV
ncbi:MAG TPA: hypothetical protein VF618_07475 [Thermoanaerobaculia bacterium]